MQLEVPVEIQAPPERVWEVLVDVESWPQWTASMRKVERLDSGPFQVGSRARIRQPRMPSVVWRVTAVEEGLSFVWEASRPGTKVVAGHVLRPTGAGRTLATLTIDTSGFAARLLAPLLDSTTRRYVEMEAEGLKRRAESTA
ncbi:MAG TPA: SRPBCC family protein [Acidimicrobiales bacterium]|nr:SRPBCC family protein [Acidimicrobiales bacterium]